MFANPEVSSFIDRLIGGQPSHLGAPPPTPGYRGALARGLFGDVTRPKIGGFQAPAIRAGRGLEASLPSEGVGRSVGSGQPSQAEFRPPSGSTGASELSSGLQKLGAGIEGGLEQLAANKQNADETAALSQGGAFPKWGGSGQSSADASPAGRLPTFAQQPGVASGTPSSANAGIAYNFFLNKGYSPNMAHAFVATLAGESGQGLNTGIYQGEGGYGSAGTDWSKLGKVSAAETAAGIANWNGPRAQKLASWAQANGMNPADLNTQLEFAHREAQQMGIPLQSNQSPAALTNMLTGTFERPAVNNGAQRWNNYARTLGSGAPPSLAAQDAAQDARQDAQDAQRPSSSGGASTTPPAGFGGPTQTGIYNGQPYTFQTQPALGPQGMLQVPQDQTVDPLALALAGGQMPIIDLNFGGGSGLFG